MDPGVLGFVPIVFNFLSFPAQLARHEELFGGPAAMLRDYTVRGLTALADVWPEAVRLAWLAIPITPCPSWS